jgi:hypothetical protein
MRKEIVTLPSGLSITLRGKTLEEDSALTDQSRGRTFLDICYDLLTECTVSVEDTGPKTDIVTDDKMDWNKALFGDFLAAVFAFHRLSFKDGHMYDIDVNCPISGKRIEWQADLRMMSDGGDIVDYILPDESAEILRSGGDFEVTVADKIVKFRLQTVADARYAAKNASTVNKKARATSLRRRIISVEGITEGNDIVNWLHKLEDADVQDLQDAMEGEDCGIDDEVLILCPHVGCSAEFMVTIPFEVSFLLPQNKKRDKRRKRIEQIRARNLQDT